MKIKRWLPALLVLVILAGCIAGTVFATEEDRTPITPKYDFMPDPRQPDVYVPPVYFGDSSENTEPAVYHTTVEDAAAELRGQLEDRVASITIGFQTTSSDYDKRLEVFNKALEHTGVPTQGDYLAYQHGAYRYSYSGYNGGGIYYMMFTYDMTYYTTAVQEAQVDTAVDALLYELNVYDASDYEKISAVYDYMCENITYDYDGLEQDNLTDNNKKIYTAYGALIDGTSVCQGYANLFYRLALELGVDTRIISGIGNGGGHAWNIVELDDLYYNVDATWDATYKQAGQNYEYFLRCDENFEDHTRDAEFLTAEFTAAYPMGTTDYTPPVTIASGTCGDNLTWALNSEGTLAILGAGKMYDFDSDYSNNNLPPWYNYRSSIIRVTVGNEVTSIGAVAFFDCSNLMSVNIGDSCATIGISALSGCESLVYHIYDNAKYLGNSKNPYLILIESINDTIKSCSIHPNARFIYSFAFYGCRYLESITIPNNITDIGNNAFTACWNLVSVDLGTNLLNIGSSAFYNCVRLESIVIPKEVISIGNYAFKGCADLSGIWVDEENTTYKSDSFGILYNKDITTLLQAPGQLYGDYHIPNGVIRIVDSAFYSCDDLTSLTVPESVLQIDVNAICGCLSLTGIWVDENNPNYSNDENGVLFDKNKSTLFQAPGALTGNYTIPNSVICIEDSAFYPCIDLESVIIPNSVTEIKSYAFYNCNSLTSVVIPDSITNIGHCVFSYCPELKSVTIPSSVVRISDYAFEDCAALNQVIYRGTKTQWEAIDIEANNPLLNATILYTGEIKLKNAAPTLYDNIAMNYKADKTRFDELGIANPYLVVSFNGNETTITDYVVNDDGQYVFTFYNIAPNQMDDTLTATLYATYGDGVYEGATLEYSVATYCYRMLNNSTVVNNDAYAELRTLLVDLLHYGAMAQRFTGFTGETVDARLTDAQAAWGTVTDPTLEEKTSTKYATIDNPTVAWKSVGLVLEDAVTMRFKFTAPDITGLSVKITSDTNAEGWVINASDFQYEESTERYYVDFGGLHAGQMRECVYVTVYDGDTAISNTLRYTIESYAKKYQAADTTAYPYLAELVKAMMRYGDAAYAFAN